MIVQIYALDVFWGNYDILLLADCTSVAINGEFAEIIQITNGQSPRNVRIRMKPGWMLAWHAGDGEK